MSDSIYAEFNYAGGIVEAEISAKSSRITFRRGDEEVVIEEAYGDVFRFDHPNFTLLTGAAQESFCQAQAKEYAINAIGNWIVCASSELSEAQSD